MTLFRLVGLSAWRNSLQQWTWRSFMITLVLDQAIAPVIGLLVWTSVEPTSDAVGTYFFVLLAVQLMTVSYEDHTLCGTIFDGTIAERMLVPQPVITDTLGSNLGLRFWHTVFGLPILAGVGIAIGVQLDPSLILTALPAVIIAGGLRFLFTFTVALTAFWTERATALVSLSNTVIALLGGIGAPLFLLPTDLGDLGRLLPFWSFLGFPAELAAGVLSGGQIAVGYLGQAVWLVVLSLLAAVVWRRGVRLFTAVGG